MVDSGYRGDRIARMLLWLQRGLVIVAVQIEEREGPVGDAGCRASRRLRNWPRRDKVGGGRSYFGPSLLLPWDTTRLARDELLARNSIRWQTTISHRSATCAVCSPIRVHQGNDAGSRPIIPVLAPKRVVDPTFPIQPCWACRTQQQNYLM